MDTLIELARGPLFRLALALSLLGLCRRVFLGAWLLHQARRRAGTGRVALGPVLLRTLKVLNPVRHLLGNRGFYTAGSLLFHLGVVVVPVFLAGHVRLWGRGIGITWPALPAAAADGLTLVTLASAAFLLAGRAWHPASRAMSRLEDWALPALIGLVFLSGWLVAHPAAAPRSPRLCLLVHAGTADLLLALAPFTKIAHCALLPFSQLVNEAAWRLVPGAGREVIRTLGKEGQPI